MDIDNYPYLIYYLYMYKDVLEKSGLKSGEAEIYDILLQYGDSPASDLTSKTKFKRGMVYKYLKDLKQQDLVSTYQKNKKTYFKPKHPYNLMESIESVLNQAKAQETILKATLPQLVSTFNTTENKPGVRIFEGIEGIKEVYKDTLRENPKEILGILQTSQVEPEIYKWLTTTYARKRSSQGIRAKVITTSDKKLTKYVEKNEEEKRETRIVPKQDFPIAVEMNIYNNKVAFMNFKKGENHIGIIINNKLIADTMKALFSLAWEGAKHYKALT